VFGLILTAIAVVLVLVVVPVWNKIANASNKGGHADYDRMPTIPGFVIPIALAVVALPAVLSTFVQIDAGHIGVVTRFGAATGNVFEQGLHTKVPYIEDVAVFNVQTQKEQVKAEAASHDLQDVHADVALNYHLTRDSREVVTVFVNIGLGYKDRVIDPAIQEAFKATTAQFTAQELITNREAVKTKARETLSNQLAKFHVVVDELNITNFEFSKEFQAAIEQKQVADQNAETANNKLRQVQTEAQQRVAQAKADADSVRLAVDAQAYKVKVDADAQAYAQEKLRQTLNDLYLQWLTLQNQASAIKQWDGKLPTYNMGGAQPFINLPAKQ
jgi:regulator of protease activity HflC (stomatin/prohibitin superfamily)